MLEATVKAKLTEMYVTQNNETTKQRKCSIPLGQVYQLRRSTLYKDALELQNDYVPTTDLFYEELEVGEKIIKVTRNVRKGSNNPKIETFVFEVI